MTRIMGLFAVLGAALILTTPAWGDPHIHVTANHLGGGVIQYTIDAHNDLGGSSAVQITAVGKACQAKRSSRETIGVAKSWAG